MSSCSCVEPSIVIGTIFSDFRVTKELNILIFIDDSSTVASRNLFLVTKPTVFVLLY